LTSETELLKDYVIAVMERMDLQSQDAIDVLRPFFGQSTELFVHEIISFARSPFTMEIWDGLVQYDEDSLPLTNGMEQDVQRSDAGNIRNNEVRRN
jgi:hypothetical protein